VVQLAQLHGRELGLRHPAAGEDVHVGGAVRGQPGVHVVRDLGGEHVVGVLRQHPRDVQRHVPGPDHPDVRGVQGPVPRDVRVSVEPLHELGGAVAAGQADPRDAEVPVPFAAGRDDHRVVEHPDVGQREVPPVRDVAEQPHPRPAQHGVQRPDDPLDPRVVRRDAVPDQAERRRQPVEEIDRTRGVRLHQRVGGVDPRRSRPDDGDPKLPRHAPPLLRSVITTVAEER